jgi:hypothetical protein
MNMKVRRNKRGHGSPKLTRIVSFGNIFLWAQKKYGAADIFDRRYSHKKTEGHGVQ